MIPEEPSIDWKMLALENSQSKTTFMGTFGSQKVFIKSNANPILPSLSSEGISPKIQWIRKIENGDTLTAQSWIEGRTLKEDELYDDQVYEILKKLHTSRTLRDSFSNFNRLISRPAEMLRDLVISENSVIATNTFLKNIVDDMMKTVPILNNLGIVVVHGNIVPENWLKDEKTGKIYLTGWDNVSLGDAFLDNAFLLSHYIPKEEWGIWLAKSGDHLSDVVTISKLIWYGKLSFLRQIQKYLLMGNTVAANAEIQALRKFKDSF
ncbi:MAG: phosphotransferase [Lactovum sp.]